ncbi:MAG: hypothetical protein Unbinned306contig1002_21 [Prokaryotic dsDNA virus sp.]|nr:MAG: hypothetical protein Unbinned306contig1002_21 [Prokaryotic dsDNA virus sp.]|tara:strand:- start:19122 stop:19283 length:162 start_codon:yes stop_codon:yes gene_type:complete
MNNLENIKKWIKNKSKPKYIIIQIPRNFKNKRTRNKFLIETKKHLLDVTKIKG